MTHSVVHIIAFRAEVKRKAVAKIAAEETLISVKTVSNVGTVSGPLINEAFGSIEKIYSCLIIQAAADVDLEKATTDDLSTVALVHSAIVGENKAKKVWHGILGKLQRAFNTAIV